MLRILRTGVVWFWFSCYLVFEFGLCVGLGSNCFVLCWLFFALFWLGIVGCCISIVVPYLFWGCVQVCFLLVFCFLDFLMFPRNWWFALWSPFSTPVVLVLGFRYQYLQFGSGCVEPILQLVASGLELLVVCLSELFHYLCYFLFLRFESLGYQGLRAVI